MGNILDNKTKIEVAKINAKARYDATTAEGAFRVQQSSTVAAGHIEAEYVRLKAVREKNASAEAIASAKLSSAESIAMHNRIQKESLELQKMQLKLQIEREKIDARERLAKSRGDNSGKVILNIMGVIVVIIFMITVLSRW